MIKGIVNYTLSILDPIGNSDHKTLKLEIKDANMRIARRVFYTHIFSKIDRNHEAIGKLLVEALNEIDKFIAIRNLVHSLRREFKPKEIKLNSLFKVIENLY